MTRMTRRHVSRRLAPVAASALLIAATPGRAQDSSGQTATEKTWGAATGATGTPEPNPDCAPPGSWKSYSLAAGAKLGMLNPIGLGAMLSLPGEGKVRWQIDVVWEPSNYLQSYSIGGSYHLWDKVFFAGARLRLMQLHAPWSRGFRARTDNQLALGPEIGVRLSLGAAPRVLPFASLGIIFFPSETLSLPPMISLDIGAAVDLVRGRLP